MRIMQLEKADCALAAELDPLFYMDRLEFPDSFALLAVDTDENTGEDSPVGLLIGELRGERVIIDWLYVRPDRRIQGIGEKLLVHIFTMASAHGYTSVCAYMNREYGREDICDGEDIYFGEHLFEQELRLGGEWQTDLRTLVFYNRERSKARPSAVIRRFSDQTAEEMQHAIQTLLSMDNCDSLYALENNPYLFDRDVSCLAVKNEKICGALLVQAVSRNVSHAKGEHVIRVFDTVLYLTFFYAECGELAQALAESAISAALQKYDQMTEVHVILQSDADTALAEKILGEPGMENRLLLANMRDFQNEKVEDEQALCERRILQLG